MSVVFSQDIQISKNLLPTKSCKKVLPDKICKGSPRRKSPAQQHQRRRVKLLWKKNTLSAVLTTAHRRPNNRLRYAGRERISFNVDRIDSR
jgi:hypothetical protein